MIPTDQSAPGSAAVAEGATVYRGVVLAEVPRILGLGDRDPASPTFGCFDRAYWHYRLSDFPNPRFQEVALLLARLHQHDFPANHLYGKRVVSEWVAAAVRFWLAYRNRDGSVPEVYPNERSFCATAFGFWAVTETCLVMGWSFDEKWDRTAQWLARAGRQEAANQEAAAALALFNWFLLTGESRYRECAARKVDVLCARQDGAGCFPEYGGQDLGYHTLTLGQLTRYQQKAKHAALVERLVKAVQFVEDRLDSTGRHDASIGSRRTQFVYPYGLVALESRAVGRHVAGVRRGDVLHPGWLDDRYVIQLSVDFLEAALELTRLA